MTQLEQARRQIVTDQVRSAAEREPVSPEEIANNIRKGTVVLPANRVHIAHGLRPVAIGRGLTIKVNANIGTSTDIVDLDSEKSKLNKALEAGTDAVMDLSTGGNIDFVRKELIRDCPAPFGTVPLYQAEYEVAENKGNFLNFEIEDFLKVLARHGEDGVDFVTIHSGLRQESLRRLQTVGRLTRIVSRGGGLMAAWMIHHNRENPLYEHFDRILDICRDYDMTISLGDGLRPGSLADATDAVQMDELLTLGELVEVCRNEGVQVMVEGPGHIPLDEIHTNIQIQKKICRQAPFYVLGPLVTDVAAGWDHVNGAIGGAVAGMSGADFLCYVTPTEHLGLPTPEDVYEGVMVFRVAAHAADIARGLPGSRDWDDEMSRARYDLDWKKQLKLAMDPRKAQTIHEKRSSDAEGCTMCGSFCPMNLVEKTLVKKQQLGPLRKTDKKTDGEKS